MTQDVVFGFEADDIPPLRSPSPGADGNMSCQESDEDQQLSIGSASREQPTSSTLRKQPSKGKPRLQQPVEEPRRPHAKRKKRTTVDDVDIQIMEVIRDIRHQTKEKDTAVEERRSFTDLEEEAFCRMVGETLETLSQPAEELQK